MSTAIPVTTTAAAPLPTITAEQFAARPDPGHPEELLKGRIFPMPPTGRRHGQICSQVGRLLGNFAEQQDLGHVLTNDAGIVTGRDPDTVRGADVAFYSYARLPRGELSPGYGPEVPELVVEVLSPSDRWSAVLAKIGDYLSAGVSTVLVLDDETRSAQLFRADAPPRTLGPDDVVRFPDVLPGFETAVRLLFG